MGNHPSRSKSRSSVSVHRFGDDDLRIIRRAFRTLSQRSPGTTINKATFKEVFHLPDDVCDRIFNTFDTKGTGVIDSEEFMAGIAICSKGDIEEKISFLFAMMDSNGDGNIYREDLSHLLHSIPLTAAKMIAHGDTDESHRNQVTRGAASVEKEVDAIFAKCDLDKNQQLSFDEFRKWIMENKHIIHILGGVSPYDKLFHALRSLTKYTRKDEADPRTSLKRFDSREQKVIQHLFRDLADRSPGKKIDKDIFLKYFPLPVLLGERAFFVFDKKRNGSIDFEEFALGLGICLRGTTDEKLNLLFEMFDMKEDGHIHQDELRLMLHHCPQHILRELTNRSGKDLGPALQQLSLSSEKGDKEDVRANVQLLVSLAFQKCDLNKDAKLSFPQFKMWVEKNPEIQQLIDGYFNDLDHTLLSKKGINGQELEVVRRGHLYFPPSGLLKKKVMKEYQKGFFVLRRKHLYRYKESSSKLPEAVVFLEGAFVKPTPPEVKGSVTYYGIEITFQRFTERIVQQVFCLEKKVQEQWLTDLKVETCVADFEEKYQLLQMIGEGMAAKVYLAFHRATNASVAVKVIKKADIVKDENLRNSLQLEIATLRLVRHPNIIRMLDVIESEENLYIVLDYVSGGELFDYVKRHKSLSEAQAQRIMRQLVDAVSYLHDVGIIHRDLKLENVLIRQEDESVVITDFGLSAVVMPQEELAHPCGTPAYLAPEICQGDVYGKPADVWSLGVILYILLSGHMPFGGRNTKELLINIAHKSPRLTGPLWDHISTEAKSLLKNMLSKTPTERLSAAQLLQSPWMSMQLQASGEGLAQLPA